MTGERVAFPELSEAEIKRLIMGPTNPHDADEGVKHFIHRRRKK